MEIKRDSKYYLCSDSTSCWIEEEYTVTNKETGKTTIRTRNISGWYPNFRMLAESGLPSRLVRSAEGKSLKRALEFLRREEKKIAKMTIKKMGELGVDLDKPLK